MIATLAQVVVAPAGAWSLTHLLVVAIIVGAVVAIAVIALRAMGVAFPPWVVQIFWVVVIAVVAVFAIKFLLAAV